VKNLLIFCGLGLAATGAAAAANIQVQVRNAPDQQGQVVVALFASEKAFLETPLREATAAVDADGVATVSLDGVEPGEYAISTYHDQNANGQLDTKFMGIPKEPFAFSNNASRKFGPAKWEDARFELADEDLVLVIDFP
jgi:uncharacterized protein (DUF2141 family)